MKIFENKMDGHNKTLSSIFGETTIIVLCIETTRTYFDIPTASQIVKKHIRYCVSVFDRKEKNAVKIRPHPNLMGAIQAEYEERWRLLRLYRCTRLQLLTLFKNSGKKVLYVRMEELY